METKPCPKCGQQLEVSALLCRFCQADFREVPPPPPPRPGGGGGIVGILVVVGLIVLVAIIAIPGILMGSRASNERNASASLKTILTAEADFRSNDRDNDGVQNFWVRDVYGLYALCPSPDGTKAAKPDPSAMIKLVEPSLAGADGTGKVPCDGSVPAVASIGMWSPKASYVYRALEAYEEGGRQMPYASPGPVAAHGAAYHLTRYGFITQPATSAAGATRIFIADESCTIWRFTTESSYKGTYRGGAMPNATFTWSGSAVTPAMPYPETPGAAGWSKLD